MKVWRLLSETATSPVKQTWEISLELGNELNDAAWMDQNGYSTLYLTTNDRLVLEYKFPQEGSQPPTQSSLNHLYAQIVQLYPQTGGDLLIGVKDSGGLDIFDTGRHVIEYAWKMFDKGAPAISWSPDPNYFLVTHANNEIRLYDLRKGVFNKSFSGFKYLIDQIYIKLPKKVMEAAFHGPDQIVIRMQESEYLYLYDIKTKSINSLIGTEGEIVEKIVALPNFRFATIAKTGLIRIYDSTSNNSSNYVEKP